MIQKAGPIRMRWFALLLCSGVLCAAASDASAAVAYTILDLGPADQIESSSKGYGTLNAAGQVIGSIQPPGNGFRAYRTSPNSPIQFPGDDLGTLDPGLNSTPYSINASGQVVGTSSGGTDMAFRTAPNAAINPATDYLGTLNGLRTSAYGINASGQAIGMAGGLWRHSDRPPAVVGFAFRTAPNAPINSATDNLGPGVAVAINDAGQVVGSDGRHAFRTKPNAPIDPATDDLGTLPVQPEFADAAWSIATGINGSGRVIGYSTSTHGDAAFRTAPNAPINPLTDDLGELSPFGPTRAYAINAAGQVVGTSGRFDFQHAFFVDSTGPMLDLNDLTRPGTGWVLNSAHGINDAGQIAGTGTFQATPNDGISTRAFLLTPARPGDATGDGRVNFGDLVVLAQNYNRTDRQQTWWTGDFTGDGSVDFADLVQLAQNYNTGPVGPAMPAGLPDAFAADFAAAQASVPEPSGLVLVLITCSVFPEGRYIRHRPPRRPR
jgi:probable HAF family extracellular repeat protein